jgi:hypothetical protein
MFISPVRWFCWADFVSFFACPLVGFLLFGVVRSVAFASPYASLGPFEFCVFSAQIEEGTGLADTG